MRIESAASDVAGAAADRQTAERGEQRHRPSESGVRRCVVVLALEERQERRVAEQAAECDGCTLRVSTALPHVGLLLLEQQREAA
jgi:hypothetical protein